MNAILSTAPFGSIQVFVNDAMCITQEWKQHRFPKSKKKRIRNKWSKRSENFRMQDIHKVVKIGDKMYVSQKTYDKLAIKYQKN